MTEITLPEGAFHIHVERLKAGADVGTEKACRCPFRLNNINSIFSCTTLCGLSHVTVGPYTENPEWVKVQCRCFPNVPVVYRAELKTKEEKK